MCSWLWFEPSPKAERGGRQAGTQTVVETDAKEERRRRRMGEPLQLQQEGNESII